MGGDVGGNFLGNTAEHRVTLVVAGNDLGCGGQVHLHVSGNGILDHPQGDIAHGVQIIQHADGARPLGVQMQGDFGNIAGLVGNALDIRDHF